MRHPPGASAPVARHGLPERIQLPLPEKQVSGMDAELLSETFVELTDTMVAGFDVIDFLHVLTDRSVQLLDVSAAGLPLNSRVIIEQAKGKLAERLGVDMDQAFTLLRGRARASNRRLSDLARAFIDGTEPLTGPDPRRPRPPRPATRPSP